MAVRPVDVAHRAGVAPSAVSSALSGNRPISARPRRRVEQAIAELGFTLRDGSVIFHKLGCGRSPIAQPFTKTNNGFTNSGRLV